MGWPLVRLGEVAEQISRGEPPVTGNNYRLIGVRLWGRGAYERETIDGSETKYSALYRVEAGDIVVNKIWARNGSVAVAGEDLHGTFGSSEFPTYRTDDTRLLPDWFRLYTLTESLWEQCDSLSRGTSGQNRLRPARFLEVKIPLPPLAEQHRIVARLDRVAGLVAEVKSRRAETDADATQLLERLHFDLASNDQRPFGDFVSLSEDRTEVAPDQSYPQIGIRGFAGGLFFKEATAGSDTSYKSFNRVHPDMLVVSQPKGWEGAIAVAEDEHAGWFVSPEYRTFVCREGSLLPAYLRQLVGTNWFQSELAKLTRGQGARRERLRPDMLLAMPVRMPSLAAQRKALAVHEKIQRLRAHTAPFANDADALIPALLHEVFGARDKAA